MSKYPGNPWWDHAGDRPMVISSREQWDEAEANGFITTEHVLQRLEAMLAVAFEEPTDGGWGYDEDGFIRALVADGWAREGWRLQLHPNDHDPPHLHFWNKDDPKREVRLSIETGEPLDGERVPPALRKKLRKATAFILAEQPRLVARWNEIHG